MSTGKDRLLATSCLVLSAFVASHLFFWLLPNVFEPWNAQTMDQLFRLRSTFDSLQPRYDDTVIHVDLNEAALDEIGERYLNRRHYAQVVRNLSAMGVHAQVYDFIFATRRNPDEDQALLEATSQAGNVYFGMSFGRLGREQRQEGSLESRQYLDQTKWQVNVSGNPEELDTGSKPLATFADLASAARGIGYLNLRPDRDRVFRRIPLLVRYQGGYYPSLGFRVICDYLGVSANEITVTPGESLTLRSARFPDVPGPRDIVIPVDQENNMLINFVGPWERMNHQFTFGLAFRASEDRDVMEILKEEMTGKLVVVSDVSTGSSDVGSVPTDYNFPLSGVLANVMHNILTGEFLRELSSGEMLLVELLLVLILITLSLLLSSLPFSLGAVFLAIAYGVTAATLFFHFDLILNIVRPLFGIGLSAFSVIAYRYVNEEKEKWMIRKSFEAYFPPSVVKKIIANPEHITSTGQTKELTILFSDIVGFTAICATMTPEQIQKLLTDYFDAMTEVVFKYQGTVDKFIGDGLMVFFGDPEYQPDHALRCVRAAVEMQKRVRVLNKEREARGEGLIQVRIGINTGRVVVGNMGSARRLSYTVLGSDVNLAQRLESHAPEGRILISDSTYRLVQGQIQTANRGEIQVKGIDEPVCVHEVEPEGATA